ncbi:N-acetylglucosamine-6-phosphate deacetylase [Gracilibacillus sp. JCM 18860]|uniref:N-acetylglucosamine-6-phosphate deacetylase n=1 Tax=Gracilibacillus sp. JCM 18860 TaxID=1306159 RepID=UPI0006D22CCF
MSQKLLIKNVTIYTDTAIIDSGFIKIENTKITEIGTLTDLRTPDDFEIMDLSGKTIKAIPGFIDVHIHGADGADVMDGTSEALHKMAMALPKEGTTSFLATTMTQSNTSIEKALSNTVNYMSNQPATQAEIIGIHLEGPFINETRKGAQPAEHIQKPNLELFKKWNELAKGKIKLVTLAPPEIDGSSELIEYFKNNRIIASAGHTDASSEQINRAIKHGLSHITHLYNQMRGFHHREPGGVVGAAWNNDSLMVEIIADGVHSTKEAVQIAYQQKQENKLILITDSMRAKCLKDGVYDLGGQEVTVKNQEATLKDGTLAGSTLKLGDGFKNIIQFTDCSIEAAICMSSQNAAKELGIYEKKGSITVGKDADIVLLNEDNDVITTICRGNIAYSNE